MAPMRYQWQGKDVGVRFGFVRVKPNTEKPLYWYNYECATSPWQDAHDGTTAIPAIEVTYTELSGRTQVFRIANHHGIGAHKLKNGGWPTHQHFSFGDGQPFTECDLPLWAPRRLDEPGFAVHEAQRQSWMKKEHPEEYQRMEGLRQLIAQNRRRPLSDRITEN